MVRVVAEIGCNHRGSFETAIEMVEVAADFCKADVVKFQKRTPSELLSREEYEAPHPEPWHAYGATYGEHREALELTLEQHADLKRACEKRGVVYSTSVWDATAAREIASLAPAMVKIPSACNLDFELLETVCTEFDSEIHVSLGMTTREEESRIFEFLERKGRISSLVLYASTSGYPVDFDEICLLEITRLKETYGDRVKAIGFSGHHLGIAADVAAMTLGASWIERHFTLDRTWKGTDHAASLEPDGLRRLVRDLGNVSRALTPKQTEILPVEESHRRKLKRRTSE